uniref:Uncharacterized protein n=1 Tax=Siphoviridae sp. ctkL423 TaxID=2823596 RepID=A0A8S5LE36_9CAUD|nr:MAG TPA: hypothetical protein [Siphoviridae sp. ctkL423]
MNTPSVQYLCRKDKRLAKAISMVGTITYSPYKNGYPFLVEQMLSTKISHKIFDISPMPSSREI